MNKSSLVILARMDSRRLPGKGLKLVGERPVLGLVIDKLKQCKTVQHIILATTARPVDDPLLAFAQKENIDIFRGSAENVTQRCLACCEAFDLDWMVRICGDSPFVPTALIDRVADAFITNDCDIATNVFPRGYPVGASVEAISRKTLQSICKTTKDAAYLEHVTLYAYAHSDQYSIFNLAPTDDRYKNITIAIDTPEDLEMARWIVNSTPRPGDMGLDEIVARAKTWRRNHNIEAI